MNILMIGGTRFFGLYTVRQLIGSGHHVTIATRGSHGNPFGGKTAHIMMDRTDEASVKRAIGNQHYDLIIDKVAYSSNDVRALLKYAHCQRYLQMSSCAVYSKEHLLIREAEFDPAAYPLVWSDRTPDYAEGKRQAERAALEFLDGGQCTFVRYPVVMGPNDYTGRLRFYAEHIRSGIPMRIDAPECRASYIYETEAGAFIAYLAEHPVSGAVNGCSVGGISQGEITAYIEKKTGRKAILSEDGDPVPYNGFCADVSYDCTKAEGTGFAFSPLSAWIAPLLDSLCS